MHLNKILIVSFILFSLSCKIKDYDYNNPVDPKSDNYQGYHTISDINSITAYQLTSDSDKLSWDNVNGATKYQLIIGNNESFSTIYYQNENIITNSISIKAIGLTVGDNYYKVRAFRDNWGEWSETLSFTIDLSVPLNLSPESSEVITDTTPTLRWDEVTGAIGYKIEINTSDDFTGIGGISDETLTTNSYTVSITLNNNQNYYWRVRQKDDNGVWSDWSDVNSFDLYSIDYAVGDIGPTGGYIFYVDSSGSYDGWRYLEVAPEDISEMKLWGTYDISVSGADGTAVGTGAQNTLDIIAGDYSTTNAAHACADYSLTVDDTMYDDWFLPSKDELDFMYVNLKLNGLGGFQSSFYCSSSEFNSYKAWIQDFSSGLQYTPYLELNYFYVRPVRAF